MKKLKVIAEIIFAVVVCGIIYFNWDLLTEKQSEISAEESGETEAADDSEPISFSDSVLSFSIELLQESMEDDENVFISPISAMVMLGMVENGAAEDTLSEIESVLGGYDVDTLNDYVSEYLEELEDDEQTQMSNSIWILDDEDRIQVKQSFLETNEDYYGSDVFYALFDETTLTDMNNWIFEQTDGEIENAINAISEYTVMYLINMVLFEATWDNVFTASDVSDGEFTNEDGTVTTTDFMYCTESIYLEDDDTTGFMKKYEGGKYSFIALRPEGDIYDYIDSLTLEKIQNLIDGKAYDDVDIGIPKFSYEYNLNLVDILSDMGMPLAFCEGLADFSNMAYLEDTKDLFVEEAFQSTTITVNESGTKAGAATITAVSDGCEPEACEEVILDKSFVYMIYDNEMEMPIFIGVLMDADDIEE